MIRFLSLCATPARYLCLSWLVWFVACTGTPAPAKPTLVIVAPPSGSVYTVGEQIAVQSSSADAAGVMRVELLVDGAVVRTDPSPVSSGQVQFSVIQNWTAAVPGTHTLSVRAYNVQGAFAEAGIVVTVNDRVSLVATPVNTIPPIPTALVPPTAVPPTDTPTALPTNSPTPVLPTVTSSATPTTLPPTVFTCVLNAQFVADLTIPDGTQLNPGTSFTKMWRVRNNGTCTWDAGFTIALVSGSNLASFTQNVISPTAPGATLDIAIPMTAPGNNGAYKSTWRLRDGNGQFFGTNLTVLINVGSPASPTPTNPPGPTITPTLPPPVGCSGTPNDFTFSVSPASITAGQSATLSWSAITNASGAFLDGEGVQTPGNRVVSPSQTQSYTLVATCGTNSRTKQVTVSVSGGGGGFSGHWNIKNAGAANCTADFTILGNKLSGTFCRKGLTHTQTGALQGTVSQQSGTTVVNGNYTSDVGSGTFKFYLGNNANRFSGSWFALGSTLEFCGWRDGSSPPNQCLK